METWDAVQKVNQRNSIKIPKIGEQRLFGGILRCADCGSSMCYGHGRSSYTSRITGEVHTYAPNPHYTCRHYHNTARGECSIHTVSEKHLSQVVFAELKRLIDGVKVDEGSVVNTLTNRLVGEHKATLAQREKEMRTLRKRIMKLETTIAALYEAHVTGQSTDSDFSETMRKHEAERLECENRLTALEENEQESDEVVENIHRLARSAREYLNVTEINRDLLDALVEKIEVGEAELVDGVKKQGIIIYYKFIGCLDGTVANNDVRREGVSV